MDVWCVNPECPEHEVVKSNPFELPPDEIVCGACGQPVQATEAQPKETTT